VAGSLVTVVAAVVGRVADGVVDGSIFGFVGFVGFVASGSPGRPSPAGGSDEHATAREIPTSRIAATRTDPARRTARTVPGTIRAGAARGFLDEFHRG
jgi:hypothetical protein